MTRRAHLTAALAVVLSLASGRAQQDAPLPLAPIGGIPIEIVIEVDYDYLDAIDGYELESHAGSWTHTQEGRLFQDAGWLAHADHIDGAHGSGRLICWDDWGQDADTPHWTVQWSSELTLPEPERRASAASFPLPPIHVAIEGNHVLVIYAPPREFTFWFPGSPDECEGPDPVPAHENTAYLVFDLDEVDVVRPRCARTSFDTVIQDGIVLLRLPLERLRAGTTDVAGVNLGAADGDVEWGLRIGLTLTSLPGSP
jgi:hypothetical protein